MKNELASKYNIDLDITTLKKKNGKEIILINLLLWEREKKESY